MTRINSHVLMSSATFFSNQQQINPYYHDEPVDVEVAVKEHENLAKIMAQANVSVQHVSITPDSQDGVYTANWALVRGGEAILARLPEARRAEEDWAEKKLRDLNINVTRVPEDWRFSGQGDALPCGEYLFCGQGYRSNVRAQAFAAEKLGYTRVQLQTVPQRDSDGKPVINSESGWEDSFYYDIDLAMAIIRPPIDCEAGIIAFCHEAFTDESLKTLLSMSDEFDFIAVSEDEAVNAFACNLVSTGDTVIMSAHAPLLKADLEARGLQIFTPEVKELAKGGGFIRCQTLSLNE